MGRDWSVLIVEDDARTAELFTAQLAALDINVRVARNGQEAILITGSQAPELIIMDLMMPELDGFETSRYLKHKFEGVCVPILVVTAIPDEASREECGRIGCEDLIGKPYDIDDLITACVDLVELGRVENQLLTTQEARQQAKRKERRRFDEEISSLTEQVCTRRQAVLERLLDKEYFEMVSVHSARVEALEPAHPVLAKVREATGKVS